MTGTLFDIDTSRPDFAHADMAVYTFRRNRDGAILQSTDPGRGIRSGTFTDLNRFKTRNLRGLASRALYFHNGFAADLGAVVDFYEDRFHIGFTKQDKLDLVAFLRSL